MPIILKESDVEIESGEFSFEGLHLALSDFMTVRLRRWDAAYHFPAGSDTEATGVLLKLGDSPRAATFLS